jgi:hypothetical protein
MAKSQSKKPHSKKPPRMNRGGFVNIHEEAILSLAGLATTYSSKS